MKKITTLAILLISFFYYQAMAGSDLAYRSNEIKFVSKSECLNQMKIIKTLFKSQFDDVLVNCTPFGADEETEYYTLKAYLIIED